MITLKDDPAYHRAAARRGTEHDFPALRSIAAHDLIEIDREYFRLQHMGSMALEVADDVTIAGLAKNLAVLEARLEEQIHTYRVLGGAAGAKTFEIVIVAAYTDDLSRRAVS